MCYVLEIYIPGSVNVNGNVYVFCNNTCIKCLNKTHTCFISNLQCLFPFSGNMYKVVQI
jgi:hypothetical protein